MIDYGCEAVGVKRMVWETRKQPEKTGSGGTLSSKPELN
jgi:hypothetical protein